MHKQPGDQNGRPHNFKFNYTFSEFLKSINLA